MSQTLFNANTIAVIWDFDKTLNPGYMQEPLFRHYRIEESTFWREVNALEPFHLERGAKRVSKDTLYLTSLLSG